MNTELEKAFEKTTKLLLGAELRNLDEYGPWIGSHVPLPYPVKSALSGKEVWVPPPTNYLKKAFNPTKIVSFDEMDKVNTSPYSAEDIKNATIKEIREKFIKPVAFHCGNFRYRTYENIEKTSGAGDGRNIYYCEDVYLGVKNVAFSNYALFCENMFGCHSITQSGFCIHAYNSLAVNRCFEVDGCSNSSDLLFCHNCENVHDSMFCFNAKNLKHAIGNVQVPMETYRTIKTTVLNQMTTELQKTKRLDLDIFNVGEWHG
ncbi:MAG: hypothetical protein V1492_01615 [Candidatus Micrarchaeota archaeon]